MKKLRIHILSLIVFFLSGCTENAKKQIIETSEQVTNKIKTISDKTIESVKTYKNSIIESVTTSDEIATESTEVKNDSVIEPKLTNEKFLGITYFKKFLSECKTGETITQKELIENHNVPADGIRLIKSITKTAEDEIEVKWKSTWIVEQISDAKFTDAKMKIKFEANKMYTSGKAIGIKYNKKIYNDLIIIGNAAYIPSVKGFHWKIGK
ncbi:MAG: hypothetical protein ABI441_03290 [Flavobacterium sp.]